MNARAHSGFTLVEILVVVVILSIFAGMISLSVGSSESRKNRAFYEHLIDSLQYVRLLSAERMQPMGLALQFDTAGRITPVILTLSDPYHDYETAAAVSSDASKNAMELSAMQETKDRSTPVWEQEPEVSLPIPSDDLSITINPLQMGENDSYQMVAAAGRTLQPWFVGQSVPQVIWFGTGEATPVAIEIFSDNRPVGETIIVEANGSIKVGQAL